MMASPSKLRLPALAALLVSAAACDLLGPDGPSGPGYFEMELGSLHNLEGAAVFHLEGGGGLGAVTSEGGEAYWEHHGESSEVVIVMDEPGTIRFRVATDNVGKLPTVTVTQVAGADNLLRTSTSGYLVSVRRVEAGAGGAP